MRLLLSWLVEHLDGAPSADVLAERLTAAGFNVEVREPSGDDEAWDVDITTNRPDAMNHRGLAREAAAAGCGTLAPPAAAVSEGAAVASALARVTVEDAAGCPRYCARLIRGVTVGPSPAWLAARLEACGIRPINNVVDATNYVLLDVGQPLHAFDLARLAGAEIVVRAARAGEALTTLDGVRRALEPSDLVIADREKAVALAGVMGGAESEIAPATRDVLLESACFDPTRVRRTARRLGLSTEASFRFERGSDAEMARAAADMAAALIARLAGGEVASGVLDSAPGPRRERTIAFALGRLDRFAGCSIPRDLTLRVLETLGMAPSVAGDTVTCTVPSWRVDLELAEDVYEEVLRHFGYDRIPAVLPEVRAIPGARQGSWPLTERARDVLASAGLAEAVTYSFTSVEAEAAAAASPLAVRGAAIELTNPLSARLAVMRRSLLAGVVEAAAGNLRRGAERVALGEVGRAYFARDGRHWEEERLAVVLGGAVGPWDAVRASDFLDLKGLVEGILDGLGTSDAQWRPATCAVLAPGQGAEILAAGEVIGIAGRLAEGVEALFESPSPLWVAEVDLASAGDVGHVSFTPLPRFPAVPSDLTIRHGLDLEYRRLVGAIRAAAPDWLESVAPVVRYRGEGVGPGEVKTTLRLVYRHPDRSLTQDEVNAAHFALMDRLASDLGVTYT
ncbi:MAG: phenylalanine--tRNA ligase subunit beta [Acidobacteriota bacterium]